MGDILEDSADYDAVRYALGVDSSTVSDALIQSLNFLVYVEAEVKAMVTDWSTLMSGGGRDKNNLQLGVVHWVASRLAGYIERDEGRSYKAGPFAESVTGKSVDWRQKAADLAQAAAAHLSRISTQTAPSRLTLLTRDGPTRSRTNVPGSDEWEAWEDKIEPGVVDWLEDEQVTT